MLQPNCGLFGHYLPLGTADSFHKPGFKLHAAILHLLFTVLDAPSLAGPLWDVQAKGLMVRGCPCCALMHCPGLTHATAGSLQAYPSNSAFVREFTTELLTKSFPNLTPHQVDPPCMSSIGFDGPTGSVLCMCCHAGCSMRCGHV
jgi:hypothetical protein